MGDILSPLSVLSKEAKSKMAAAAILKNLKIALSRTQFNRFWCNLATWCISNLLNVPTVKNFTYPRWRRPPSWKIENIHISAAVQPILMKSGMQMQLDSLDRFDRNSKMAAAAILKNQKSPYLGRYSVTMRTVQSWTCELGYGADTMFHRTYFLFVISL